MDKKKIDSIVWGDFDKRILEKKIPFYATTWYLRENTEEIIFLLFRLFTNHVFEKSGYKNSLSSMSNVTVNNYIDWTVQNQTHLDYVGKTIEIPRVFTIPPVYFTQFRKKGDNNDILIVNNTHAFFQALQLLKGNEEKSFDEVRTTYHIYDDKETEIAFDFVKNLVLENSGRFQNPVLVLRPREMVLKLVGLDNYFEEYSDLPKKLLTKEEFNKMSLLDRAGLFGKSEDDIKYGQCNDENFKDLMEEYSGLFSGFSFMTFYEMLENKIPVNLDDWNEKRDGFIKNLEDMIEFEYSGEPINFDREHKYMEKAQRLHDDENYDECILNCYKALEGVLGKIHPNTKSSKFFLKMIECQKDPTCGKYADNLRYINKIRNSMSAHASPYEPNADDSLVVLQMANITFSGLTRQKIHGRYDSFEK